MNVGIILNDLYFYFHVFEYAMYPSTPDALYDIRLLRDNMN